MDAAGTLELIAEIAVAFAGFSGLLTVFRDRAEAPLGRASEGRLLIEYSLQLMAFALVPLILWHLTANEAASWRIASGLKVGILLAYYSRRFGDLRSSSTRNHFSYRDC